MPPKHPLLAHPHGYHPVTHPLGQVSVVSHARIRSAAGLSIECRQRAALPTLELDPVNERVITDRTRGGGSGGGPQGRPRRSVAGQRRRWRSPAPAQPSRPRAFGHAVAAAGVHLRLAPQPNETVIWPDSTLARSSGRTPRPDLRQPGRIAAARRSAGRPSSGRARAQASMLVVRDSRATRCRRRPSRGH